MKYSVIFLLSNSGLVFDFPRPGTGFCFPSDLLLQLSFSWFFGIQHGEMSSLLI